MPMSNFIRDIYSSLDDYDYEKGERAGVIVLIVAGLLSLAAVLYLFLINTPKRATFFRTHLFGYLLSMFLANTLQSVGTVMNLRWVIEHRVVSGSFCIYQGAIKQAGNVSTALWSFMISLHLFNLVFLRGRCTKAGFWATIVLGWGFVAFVVFLGPVFLETKEKGSYFGISGPWCWITENCPKERIFLEYFLEFLSVVLSIILYAFVILRVRGNLIRSDGCWHLRFVPREESWQLSFERDLIDQSMLKVSQGMVWFPVAYSIILVPITITRLSQFSGADISFGATIFGAVVFNLTGFVNVALFSFIRRLFPDMKDVPDFSTQRCKHLSVFDKGGITPFTQSRSDTAELYEQERQAAIDAVSIRTGNRLGMNSNRSSVVSGTVESMGAQDKDNRRSSFISILSRQSQLGLIITPPAPSHDSTSTAKSPVYHFDFTRESV